jgi:antitoxin (DNA-binding transcriptional repressor) of toxin-antitoxin stability system
MPTVTLEEAQARLPELIDALRPGETLVIMRDQRPIACLVAKSLPPTPQPRQPGCMKGQVLYIAPDFDALLEDFKDYM